ANGGADLRIRLPPPSAWAVRIFGEMAARRGLGPDGGAGPGLISPPVDLKGGPPELRPDLRVRAEIGQYHEIDAAFLASYNAVLPHGRLGRAAPPYRPAQRSRSRRSGARRDRITHDSTRPSQGVPRSTSPAPTCGRSLPGRCRSCP